MKADPRAGGLGIFKPPSSFEFARRILQVANERRESHGRLARSGCGLLVEIGRERRDIKRTTASSAHCRKERCTYVNPATNYDFASRSSNQ
jgi:hypothetical protein